MATPAEAIATLNGFEGDDLAAVIRLLQNDQGAAVMAARAKIASAAKRDGAKEIPALEKRAADAEARIEEMTTELEEAKKAAPDFAKREAELKASYQKKVDDAEAKAKAKDEQLRTKDRDVLLGKFEKSLIEKHNVHPKYAGRVARQEFADRFDVSGETPRILKLKETTPYDAETVDDQIDLLAADAVKTIEAEFIRAGSDQGGGRSNGAGGGSRTETKEQSLQRKRETTHIGI